MFHNLPIDAADKFVDLGDFANRAYGQIVPQRDLRLVNLATDGLHCPKVPKSELIASALIDYPETARRLTRESNGMLEVISYEPKMDRSA